MIILLPYLKNIFKNSYRLLFFFNLIMPLKAEIPTVWNVPTENIHFIGRSDILNLIHDRFKNSKKNIVVISGPSGFGKSQIAKKYVYNNYTDYDIVWWFKGGQYLEPQLENFATSLKESLNFELPDNIKSIGAARLVLLIKDFIRKKRLRCLIVFDDIQLYSQIESHILYNHDNNVHTLVTSKNSEFSRDSIKLGEFSRKESINYITQFLPTEKEESKNKLADQFGDCPSALALAIDYIQSYPGMNIEDYLQKYDSESKVSPSQRRNAAISLGSSTDGYEMDLYSAIKMNVNELRKKSPTAIKLIGFMSILHHEAISTEDINQWINNCNCKTDISELITLIRQYSLVNSTPEREKRKVCLSMHELIQKIIGTLIPIQEKKEHINEAVSILSQSFSSRTDLVVEEILKDNTPLLHVFKVSNEADKINHHTPELASLRVKAFNVLVGIIRDFDQALILNSHLNGDFENRISLNREDEIVYNTDQMLFHMLHSPDYEKAITFGLKSLSKLDEEEGMFEEKIRLYSNLIQYYTIVGDLDECKVFVDRAEQCFDKSQSDAYNALYVFAVSMYLTDLGETTKTIDFIQKHQSLLEQQEFYPTFRFFPLSQLAEAYIKNGDIKQGQISLDLAEKYAKQFYPNEENNFLCKINVLKAMCLFEHEKERETAKKLIENSIKTFEKTFKGKDKHRWQAFAYFALGKLYYLNGQLDDAIEQLKISESIYDKILKSKRVDDMSDLYKLLAIIGVDSKDESITHSYFKKQLSTFGLDHPKTQDIILYLDKKGLSLPM